MSTALDKVYGLETQIAKAENKLQFLKSQKESLQTQLQTATTRITQLEKDTDVFLKASTLLQTVSEKTRAHSIQRIETIISQALQEVLNNKNLFFRILFENKRNTTTVEFKVWDEELNKEISIIHSEAGGLKNVIGALLRLIVIDLYHPKIEGPVVLDEIGVHISKDYQARFGKFLQQYSELTGRQIILVSHQDLVQEYADKKIRITRSNTESKVTDVTDEE